MMHTDPQLNPLISNLTSACSDDNESPILNKSSSSSSSSSSFDYPQSYTVQLKKMLTDLNLPTVPSSVVNSLFDYYLEQVTLGICFDELKYIHQKFNPSNYGSNLSSNSTEHVNTPSHGKNIVDIHGNTHNSLRKSDCICPSCNRSLAAVRLAPHLEKCMGMGRNSSRVASKRIAHFVKNLNGASSD